VVPAVSIVMPTRGRVHYVERAMQSVLNQSFSDFELLVLDNSSKPDQEKILEASGSDDRIIFVDRGDTGVTEARRLGASLARGKLLALLDSDDYWDRDRLKMHLSVWNDHGIGLSWDRWAEVNGGKVSEVGEPFEEGIIRPPRLAARLYWSNFIHASAGIVTTQFAKRLGFPIPWIMSSDWLLFMRAAEYYPAYFIGQCLSYKEIDSPERVSNEESREFFRKEATAIRRWAFRHRPEVYGPEFARKKTSRLLAKVSRAFHRNRESRPRTL
jgi:glycosyltransferase involved in cell wall biosynthesis